MSVRVNLLPEATKQRDRAAQQRSLAALAGVALLAGLGGVHLWSSSQLSAAEDVLAAEQARSSELRGEEAELVAFKELADVSERTGEVLRTSLAGEVSLAGLLQDVALVMPSDAQLEALTLTLGTNDELATEVGSFNLTGKTLASHAPGVERMLLSLDKAASLRGLYLNSSTLDDTDARVATFSLDGEIDAVAKTGRYVDGLPKELG